MNKPAFQINNLIYRYPSQSGSRQNEPALNIPELTIESGQVTVIRGHNGSGKTTFLKIIAGIYQARGGEVFHASGGKIVMVQQEPYLFHSTVYQNLISPLKFSGTGHKNRDHLVKEKLAMVGLNEFEKRKARELSGGEKKRVAIARALMTEPDTLLLDEPDANVDSRTTKELETLIRTLRDSGMNIILCSHHRSFAYRCSDRIIDLFQGYPVSHDENIFKGRYLYSDGIYSQFIVGSHSFYCPSQQGDFSTIVIHPDNISLYRESSGDDIMDKKDNRLKGRILSIEAYKEGRFTLTIDCGFILKARMSGSVIIMLKLRQNEDVDLVFNPSSVRLY
jgi:tungstate transport system ATP-binding protein